MPNNKINSQYLRTVCALLHIDMARTTARIAAQQDIAFKLNMFNHTQNLINLALFECENI